MVDLGQVLDRAGPQIAGLLATSGCTVNLRLPVDPAGLTADPATLTVTPAPNAAYASGVPGLVVETSGTSDGRPAREGRTPYARVVLAPDLDVRDRTEVVVVTSRDTRLIGRAYAVTGVVRNFAGVVQILDAELVRGGQS